jgi:ABC-type multidrug transport system fused ATPase/permease subunit
VLPLEPTTGDQVLDSDKSSRTPDLGVTVDGDIELQNLVPQKGGPTSSPIIDVRNASFSWTPDSSPIIKNASFSTLRNNFVFIIGPVGCGKSTLLKGLMSETPSSRGFVYSGASGCSFVDQTPWIQHTTIRQNIVGPAILDENWYQEVIIACALEHDIAAMPDSHGILASFPSNPKDPGTKPWQ